MAKNTKVSARRVIFLFQTGETPLPEPMIPEFVEYLGRHLPKADNGMISQNNVLAVVIRAGGHFELPAELTTRIVDFLSKVEKLPLIG